nr:ribonuclease H-like domain-containing protein [Tanacetum cinerariifolium]
MYDEYNALIKNGTWIRVSKLPNVNVVRSMWLFRHKYHADGSLSRYKARLVANGRNQQYGVDCSDTFSPVVKPATIHTVLSLALARNWPVHQLDVKNAFLNGDLTETVYMYQPLGFVDSRFPHHVCRLQRSLYGFKQAPRTWFQRFASYALRVGFTSSRCDSFLFIYQHGTELHEMLEAFFSQKKYDMELLERAHNATRTSIDTESKLGYDRDPVSDSTLYRSLAGGLQYRTFTRPDISYVVQPIFLHMHDPQEPHLASLKRVLRYIRGTLDHGLQLHVSSTSHLNAYTDADWAGCLVTLSRSIAEAEYHGVANVVAETTWIRNFLAGGLQYLTFTRPDISYAVQQICLHMHDPREPHLAALKRVLHYIRGTLDHGLQLHVSSTSQLNAYTDADWAGCPVTRRSTSSYCVFLGDNLLSWSAKRQVTLSRSIAEAEYRGVANVVAETAWIRNLFRELHNPLFTATDMCLITYLFSL